MVIPLPANQDLTPMLGTGGGVCTCSFLPVPKSMHSQQKRLSLANTTSLLLYKEQNLQESQ